jgi:catechol 2,3-dioxygenase
MPTLLRTYSRSTTPLPDALRLGSVELTVTDLDRSLAWYERALGLHLQERSDGTAVLGDGRAGVIALVENRAARPAGRHAGIYHYALLFPSRLQLARAAVRLGVNRVPIQGASDHGTHEAIYLPDPDGIGIELAADRPRDVWPSPEQEFSGHGPRPLDFESLLSVVAGEQPVDSVGRGLRVGHVHLHVGSVEDGLAYYRDLIGFDVWAQLDSAAFVSAGGYHHHLGFNTWMGEGVPPVPEGTVGLRHWTVELPSQADVDAVRARLSAGGAASQTLPKGGLVSRDPWGIEVRFLSAAA